MVSSITFIYITYPTIANETFSLFNCQTLDDGISYLRRDYTIVCWTAEHIYLSLLIGLPFIFIWVLGFPIIIFIMLYKRRNDLNDNQTIASYGLFFIGLNDNAYFWEVVVSNMRKILFIICSTILISANSTLKVIYDSI